MESAADRLALVWERIDHAATHAGRRSQDITLVAVTKTIPLDRILPFLQAGVRNIGENRVQEALAKYQNSDGSKRIEAALHLIGPLQTNKSKKAAGLFDMIQTMDRAEVADGLNGHAKALGRKIPCMVEVKISPEPSKHGLEPERVVDFIAELRARTSLSIEGLMGIPPITRTAEESRPYFAKLRQLFEKTGLRILSMGMSQDFEIAIDEGSTMVRLGTAIFGNRPV